MKEKMNIPKCPITMSGKHKFEYIHLMDLEKKKHNRLWNLFHSMDIPSPGSQFIIDRCVYCGIINDL